MQTRSARGSAGRSTRLQTTRGWGGFGGQVAFAEALPQICVVELILWVHVLANGALKKLRLLRNHHESRPQCRQGDRGDVDAVDRNRSRNSFDKAEERQCEGTLAASRAAANRDFLTGFNVERDALKDRTELLGVGARQIFNLNLGVLRRPVRGRFLGVRLLLLLEVDICEGKLSAIAIVSSSRWTHIPPNARPKSCFVPLPRRVVQSTSCNRQRSARTRARTQPRLRCVSAARLRADLTLARSPASKLGSSRTNTAAKAVTSAPKTSE